MNPTNLTELLVQLVAYFLKRHYGYPEIQALIWKLGTRPDDVVLNPKTIGEAAATVAQWIVENELFQQFIAIFTKKRTHAAKLHVVSMLSRGCTKTERDTIVSQLGVRPGDALLSPETDAEHAWAIVNLFERHYETGGIARLFEAVLNFLLTKLPSQAHHHPDDQATVIAGWLSTGR